jgi:hypothetical protein
MVLRGQVMVSPDSERQRSLHGFPLVLLLSKTLYIDSKIGDTFRSFLATATGFGTVGLKKGKPFVEMKIGTLDIQHVYVLGKEVK